MELKTYYDFAQNDYLFLLEVSKQNIIANSLGAMAQSICERYLKHLIDKFVKVNDVNRSILTEVMTSHNLIRLTGFWNTFGPITISEEVIGQLRSINGYYFSTKYPGDITITLDKKDIEHCVEVVTLCKNTVDNIIRSLSV